ncbi:MAG TPA: SDR family oxidoreductase [Terriglobales bacterium]|nr:SDR family oxidoreductase [Terriglobales bacterium]
MSLRGKHALVTGSSRGIGRGIALALAQQGANVAVHYFQNEKAANDTLAKIRELGGDGFTVQADIRSTEEIRRLFQDVKREFCALDVLVHNARTEPPTFYSGPLEITLQQWETALHSQATAFLVGVREAIPFMPDGGRIIAITYAPGGIYGSWQPWVAMGAAKAALEVLCRYFAVALADRQITVNALSPGWIEDSVLNSLPSSAQDAIRDWHQQGWTPMGRLGTPADVGKAVIMMCSEQAAWVTGQLIHVDGGAALMDPGLPLEIQQSARRTKAA